MNKNAILIIILLVVIVVLVSFWSFYSPLLKSIFGGIWQGGNQGSANQEGSILDKIEAAILTKLKNK